MSVVASSPGSGEEAMSMVNRFIAIDQIEFSG